MTDPELIFCIMCEWSQNWEDAYIFSIKDLAKRLGFSVYRATKAMHKLQADGLVERASMGRPAVCSYGEIVELMNEAMPPLNGFAITEAGRQKEEYKAAEEKWNDDLRKWAEQEEEEFSNSMPFWD